MESMKLYRESEQRRKVKNRICLSPKPWLAHFLPSTPKLQCLLSQPSPSLLPVLKQETPQNWSHCLHCHMANILAPVHSARHVTFILRLHEPFEAVISFLILHINKTEAEAAQKAILETHFSQCWSLTFTSQIADILVSRLSWIFPFLKNSIHILHFLKNSYYS